MSNVARFTAACGGRKFPPLFSVFVTNSAHTIGHRSNHS
jgi:hypothetical protein